MDNPNSDSDNLGCIFQLVEAYVRGKQVTIEGGDLSRPLRDIALSMVPERSLCFALFHYMKVYEHQLEEWGISRDDVIRAGGLFTYVSVDPVKLKDSKLDREERISTLLINKSSDSPESSDAKRQKTPLMKGNLFSSSNKTLIKKLSEKDQEVEELQAEIVRLNNELEKYVIRDHKVRIGWTKKIDYKCEGYDVCNEEKAMSENAKRMLRHHTQSVRNLLSSVSILIIYSLNRSILLLISIGCSYCVNSNTFIIYFSHLTSKAPWFSSL